MKLHCQIIPTTRVQLARISVLSGCFCLSFFTGIAQGYTPNLARYLARSAAASSPEAELELLPDTPSYYIVEELYNADTLTRREQVYSLQNGDHTRFARIKKGDNREVVVTYRKISDSHCIQTSSDPDEHDPRTDSTLVWWKDGLISKASVIRHKGLRIDYTYVYEDSLLVLMTMDYSTSGKTEVRYMYEHGMLVKSISEGKHIGRNETDYLYTDTLITTNTVSIANGREYVTQTLTRIDTAGRVVSNHTYTKDHDAPAFRLYQSQMYTYLPGGAYRKVATQHDHDNVNTLEYTPGDPTIERYTWKGIDQVWLRRHIRMKK